MIKKTLKGKGYADSMDFGGAKHRWQIGRPGFAASPAAPVRIIHEASTAAADPGMSAALRSLGLLDVLLSTPAGPSVARLVSMPVCAASLRTFMNNAD
jgi:hypothetical protein